MYYVYVYCSLEIEKDQTQSPLIKSPPFDQFIDSQNLDTWLVVIKIIGNFSNEWWVGTF